MSQPVLSVWRHPEARALLARLAQEGHSASQIARALTEAGHPATRNAVIGRAGREGLRIGSGDRSTAASVHQNAAREAARRQRAAEVAKMKAAARKAERAAAKKAERVQPVAPKPAARPAPAGGVPFVSSAHDACRWPLRGDGLGLVICGAGQVPGRPYCPAHVRMAYVPLATRDVRPPADGLRARSPARAERESDLVEMFAGEAA